MSKRLSLRVSMRLLCVLRMWQTLKRRADEAKRGFWNAVCEGPVYVCCCCHQTRFQKSIRVVTEDMVGSFLRNGCAAAITDVLSWVCRTCYSHLVHGRIPPVCHLHYDPFPSLPEELQGLSAVENDLIALRIPFIKLRALASSVRGDDVKFGQLCLSGMVINVPTDLARIRVELPREFSVDDTVTVNLKRKLCHKKNHVVESVRPFKFVRALQYLISHDTLWRSAGVQLHSEFQNALGRVSEVPEPVAKRAERGGSDGHGTQLAVSEDEALSEGDLADVHSYGEETMIDDGLAEVDVKNAIINVAPSEGQWPLCLYPDKDAEEHLANPDIFGGQARPANRYSYKQLCRVELRHFIRTAARRPCNIFFKFRKLQVLDMKQLTWVRLRKSKLRGRPLPQAGQLSDPQCRQSLSQANIGFRDFKHLRGTPDYYEQGKKEAFAML
jgi:hypothetical protein